MLIRKNKTGSKIINPGNAKIHTHFYDYMECLEDLKIIPLDHPKTHIRAVYNTWGYRHNCELLINEGVIQEHYCDCLEHDKDSGCPHLYHLVRQLLDEQYKNEAFHFHQDVNQIRKEKRENYTQIRQQQKRAKLISASRSIIDQFRKDYEDRLQIEISDESMEIEALFCDDYDEMKLTYRVGNKKKYMIKNIREFLDRITEESTFRYGKDLEFKHKIDYFDDFAKAQIQFMKTHIHHVNAYYGYYTNHKELQINLDNFDEFASLYENNGGKNFDVVTSSEKPVIEISKTDDLYTFSFPEANRFFFGKKHMYEIVKHNDYRRFIKYLLDEGGKTLELLKAMKEQDLVLEENDFQRFYKYVLADALMYVDIEGEEDWNKNIYDTISCYGEMNEHSQMVVTLKYSNGAEEIEGFDKNHITSFKQDLCESYIKRFATYIDEEKHQALFNEEDDQTLEFIQMGFAYLSKYCTVYVSDELKALTNKKKYSFTVGVRLRNDLLEVDIDSLQIPKDELKDVLKAYRRRKKFFRLKNGELLLLENEELEELDEFLQDYHIQDELDKGRAIVESYRIFGLEYAAGKASNITISCDNKIKKQIQRFDEVTQNQYPVLPVYEDILRDYQKEGVAWLSLLHEFKFNGILADDMGLGKTLQVIAFLEGLKDRRTSLVVCPSSLIYNWQSEVAKFSQSLKVICITGNQMMREEKIKELTDYDLVVTSYDYLKRDIELYQEMQFNYVILDEAQYIKNQKTKNAVSVKRLHCDHRLALTGTPIENSLAELWSIFDFLMPDYLFSYHYFQEHYESEIIRNQNEDKQNDLRRLVSPFILRRNKKEVLKELPDKIERVQLVDFNEDENKLYLAHLANVNDELKAMSGIENTDKIAILAMLTRLRQLCCEPRAVYENIDTPSSKLLACMELMTHLHENKQKCLLFSSFTTMLDYIAEELKKAHISYYMLTGKTSKEERMKLVNAFQEDDTTVFLISLKAGGTGLNLTAAEAVIHFDPWWNQSAQNQATDRAYRIGQNKNVQVIELVMKNSIEEKIQKMKARKKELADAIVENNETSLKALSKEDLLELFSMD